MKRSLVCSLSVAFACSLASAEDWPQWQGKNRDGVSGETGLLQEWPAEGPPLAWRVGDLGGGFSAPAIVGGRIYGMSNRGDDEVVWALSEKDGSEIWSSRLGPAFEGQSRPQASEGPGATPTFDGGRLYVIGSAGNIACLSAEDGAIVWQKSFVDDFGGSAPAWAYRESPLIDGNKVIGTPGTNSAMMVALDKRSGETIWQTQMPEQAEAEDTGGRRRRGGSGAAYSSAIAIDFEGQRQYVQFTAKALIGVAASDGRLLWQWDRPASGFGINVTTPYYQDGLVFASSAYNNGGGVAKLTRGADGQISAEEVWFSRNIQNHHGGVAVIDNVLYGGNGGNGTGYLVCLDFKTGDVLWDEGDSDKRRVRKGAVAVADGRIYYRNDTEAKGAEDEMILIKPSPEEYIEVGRFPVPDPSGVHSWSHPVIANGKLYVRDQGDLFCYDIKQR